MGGHSVAIICPDFYIFGHAPYKGIDHLCSRASIKNIVKWHFAWMNWPRAAVHVISGHMLGVRVQKCVDLDSLRRFLCVLQGFLTLNEKSPYLLSTLFTLS